MAKRKPPSSDAFSPYEAGVRKLLDKLGRGHARYTEALIYQQQLLENIAQSRLLGDTANLRHERSRVLGSLNSLAMETVGKSFNELCISRGDGPSPERGVSGIYLVVAIPLIAVLVVAIYFLFFRPKPRVIFSTSSGNGHIDSISAQPPLRIKKIRIDMLERAEVYGGQKFGFSLWEVEIYGPGTGNLAIGATARASSCQKDEHCSDCCADKAIDGTTESRWSSEFYQPQWLEITFSSPQVVERIELNWEEAYAKAYSITVIR